MSMIHLLRTFIEPGNLGKPESNHTEAGIMWQTIILAIFILSAVGIVMVDRLTALPKPHGAAGET